MPSTSADTPPFPMCAILMLTSCWWKEAQWYFGWLTRQVSKGHVLLPSLLIGAMSQANSEAHRLHHGAGSIYSTKLLFGHHPTTQEVPGPSWGQADAAPAWPREGFGLGVHAFIPPWFVVSSQNGSQGYFVWTWLQIRLLKERSACSPPGFSAHTEQREHGGSAVSWNFFLGFKRTCSAWSHFAFSRVSWPSQHDQPSGLLEKRWDHCCTFHPHSTQVCVCDPMWSYGSFWGGGRKKGHQIPTILLKWCSLGFCCAGPKKLPTIWVTSSLPSPQPSFLPGSPTTYFDVQKQWLVEAMDWPVHQLPGPFSWPGIMNSSMLKHYKEHWCCLVVPWVRSLVC